MTSGAWDDNKNNLENHQVRTRELSVKTGSALAGTNPYDSSESTPTKRDLGGREKQMRFVSWRKIEEAHASKLGTRNKTMSGNPPDRRTQAQQENSRRQL
jgi:hypothetical protein